MFKKLLVLFCVCSLTITLPSCNNKTGCPAQNSMQQSKKGSKKAKKNVESGLFAPGQGGKKKK